MNIFCGLLVAFCFQQGWAKQRPMLQLFLMYFAGYSIYMGFGYLLVDPLFYQPGGENLGDWKKVIDMLGGSWTVRFPMFLVGAGGVLWGFFWAFFLAAYWLDVKHPFEETRALPEKVSFAWSLATVCALLLAVGMLLPTFRFV